MATGKKRKDAIPEFVNKQLHGGVVPVASLPEDVQASLHALKPRQRSLHGSKFSLAYFPFSSVTSPCGDRFGYMAPESVRRATRLPFDAATQALVEQLGGLMASSAPDPTPGVIPAGFTYLGQFVDHDVTLDVSSRLEVDTDATTVPNMRSPVLDLDSVYGRGPVLDPFLYEFPATAPESAIRFALGSNTPVGPGGPGGPAGFGGMREQKNFDVPRVLNALDPAKGSKAAIIGDPRNDENLIIVQLHHAMLKFHNAVVARVVAEGFAGDIFVEAKKRVIHHYQWAVTHDFLRHVCGQAAVDAAIATISAPVGSSFEMPVEFAVAAYRFGHSMVRDRYWVSFKFPNASLAEVFKFNRVPELPVRSEWVVDFNAFFDTGIAVPVHNKAQLIDSKLALGLESIPGFSGMMAILASRNLRRGLALGLPSGQGMADFFEVAPLTAVELTSGLPAAEVAVLESNGGLLLSKTPLWYYVLREAAVKEGGQKLGAVGARIVAETFVRMLKRDANSYLNAAGFAPNLPSVAPGDFTFADLITMAGVTTP